MLRIHPSDLCAHSDAGKAVRSTPSAFPSKQIANKGGVSAPEAALPTATEHLGDQSHVVTNQGSPGPNETRSPCSESNLGNTH